ncbi:MAG: hypothetical protein QG629_359 [Patescibacteria group bacterium]|nr:hypothetical protein [Candidatus Saccharibacteria bacterium]MDQ5963277.1 hypothetical protein [Patescibacteria group bacterium]
MKKQKQHKFLGLKINVHPAKLHIGMFVALGMILLTAGKGSAEMIQTAYVEPEHHEAGESSELRECEVRHDLAILSCSRLVTHGGNGE